MDNKVSNVSSEAWHYSYPLELRDFHQTSEALEKSFLDFKKTRDSEIGELADLRMAELRNLREYMFKKLGSVAS
jgi:hypothetical protein